MNLIIPMAGSSTRFPNLKPKWLLRHPNGNLMFYESIRQLDLENVNKIVLVIRNDHSTKYQARWCIDDQFRYGDIKTPYEIVVVPPTKSQPETVARALLELQGDRPFYIKDCDNAFKLSLHPMNSVATVDLHSVGVTDAASKSYVDLDKESTIRNIVEKQVISNLFCCGGYGFDSSSAFLTAFREKAHDASLFVSHIIYKLMLEGAVFVSQRATDYSDWGTLEAWTRYCSGFRTMFVDVEDIFNRKDGTQLEDSVIARNVSMLNKLQKTGKVFLVLMTSEPKRMNDRIEEHLHIRGLSFNSLLCGVPAVGRVIIQTHGAEGALHSTEVINLPESVALFDEIFHSLFANILSYG